LVASSRSRRRGDDDDDDAVLSVQGSLGATLKEVRPTSFLGVPRVWEKIQEKMKAAGAKASPLRMRIAAWAKSIGLQYNYSIMNKWVDGGGGGGQLSGYSTLQESTAAKNNCCP